MIINKNGNECNCGKRGCFETYCSIKRFKDIVKKELENIDEDQNINNSIQLKQVLINNLKNENIENIIKEYIDDLIVGLSNLIDMFEPEAIAFGGSFVYFKEILFDRLVEEYEKRDYAFNKGNLPKLLLASLGNDAGLIGATLI